MSKQEKTNYVEKVLFTYSTEHLPKKDKVRFYYALKGRDGDSGIVVDYEVDHLGRTVLLVPIKFAGDVFDFLKFWKCEFKQKEILVKNG